jgi:hypothetical protein
MDNTSPSKSNTLVKVIAWGAVGFAVWSLLPPEWKENINRGIYQSSEEMAAAKRRKDEQQRLELIKQSTIEYFQKHKFTLDLPQLSQGLLLPPSGVKTEPLALDNQSTPLLSDADLPPSNEASYNIVKRGTKNAEERVYTRTDYQQTQGS